MQDTNMPKNRVIIIGGDHHNGLGLARIFGLNGKKITAIIVSNKKRSWMATSKFIESHKIFSTEKDAFDFILETYSDEPDKPVLIPYSDGVAMELDLRLNQFKDNFYVPSINGEQGRIAALMDKDAQYKWAKEHGIKMAESVVVDLTQDNFDVVNILSYPVILKPVLSATGSKFDIVVCNDSKDCLQAFCELKEKSYSNILVQKYLKKRRELLIVASILKEEYMSVHEVVRRWPSQGGCGSFSCQVLDKDILQKCKKLVSEIKNEGFYGLIDVETFLVDDELYLNEINWRNSGGGFRAVNDGFYYAFWYFKDLLGDRVMNPKWSIPQKSFSMVELSDFRHVLTRNISLFQWLNDLHECRNFALWCKSDLTPFFAKFLYR